MKLLLKSSVLAIAAGSLLSLNAFAQAPDSPSTPRVDEVNARAQNQQNRIANGVNNGSLTPNEAANLQKRENNIQARTAADEAKNGGHLTAGETKRLNAAQDRASQKITDKKHNDNTQN